MMFSQPDTVVPESGSSQGYNRYAYVSNNPINRTDPSGNMPVEGCGEDGKSACTPTPQEESDLAYFVQRYEHTQCQAGNEIYCSYAELHPGEVIAYGIGSLLLAAGASVAIELLLVGPEIISGIATTAEAVNTACGGDCSDELGKLTNIAKNTWESTKGLVYGPIKNGGNTVLHILEHMTETPKSGTQSVFTIGRSQVLPLLDKAWVEIQTLSPNVVGYEGTSSSATGYLVDMGQTIGYIGGSTGASLGYPSTTILNLVLIGNEVVSAYPYPPIQ